jgi:hypothetical protein
MASFRFDPPVMNARDPACASMTQCLPLPALRFLAGCLVAGALASSPAGAAEFTPDPKFVPKPDTYICPDATGGAVDCYLQAVSHLYTMCRHVKSIEIIEFGYEKAEEGVNGAKSEYCLDKHKASMLREYHAALREASRSRAAVDAMRSLHDAWQAALVGLRWHPPETDQEYKTRVAEPYETFREKSAAVRIALETPHARSKPSTASKAGAKKSDAVTKASH